MDEPLTPSPESPTCLSCGHPLTGRQGKKFCSDQCRATYHNKRRPLDEKWIYHLNKRLRKNRKILKSLNPEGHSTLRQPVLSAMGFDFRFYTHQYRTQEGGTYYFCYEWGYRLLDQEKVLIVNWQPYMKPYRPERVSE